MYICPYCGCKNYTEFFQEFTDEYFKYRTDVCGTATCHNSPSFPDPDWPYFTSNDPQIYLVVTSTSICSVCPGRLECMIKPVVIAQVVSPEEKFNQTKPRGRKWRETIRRD